MNKVTKLQQTKVVNNKETKEDVLLDSSLIVHNKKKLPKVLSELETENASLKTENEYLNSVVEQAFTPVEKEGTSITLNGGGKYQTLNTNGSTTSDVIKIEKVIGIRPKEATDEKESV